MRDYTCKLWFWHDHITQINISEFSNYFIYGRFLRVFGLSHLRTFTKLIENWFYFLVDLIRVPVVALWSQTFFHLYLYFYYYEISKGLFLPLSFNHSVRVTIVGSVWWGYGPLADCPEVLLLAECLHAFITSLKINLFLLGVSLFLMVLYVIAACFFSFFSPIGAPRHGLICAAKFSSRRKRLQLYHFLASRCDLSVLPLRFQLLCIQDLFSWQQVNSTTFLRGVIRSLKFVCTYPSCSTHPYHSIFI